ncbi:MAG TPA: glycoside hydrolase family 30 beta sandwich domain-containing protein, partial [Cyclobacteriaceae bacterium]|nr:glycoside hydrolase family 30 beta sandwich domain-containing protein [Cyclobacteriaceae bacterium]
ICILLCLFGCSKSDRSDNAKSGEGASVDVWLTSADKTNLFTQSSPIVFKVDSPNATTIQVDSTIQFQTMDGFGYALTGGSAQLMMQKMNAADRTKLLRELFLTTDGGIGISYLRISMGSSDLDDHVFSYDDNNGVADPSLSKFSLDPDRAYLIPVLKEVISLNPEIKIMGSPWCAPAWMTTNNAVKGGSLNAGYYQAYANYFVKYVQGMASEGITIDAVTVQNEPENPGNTPSMVMTSTQQNDFVKTYLGPAFKAANIKTKIVIFDHNCDHPDYPISILNDAATKDFVDGSAFHLYIGDISALSTVHSAHPDKNLYFTEQWTSGKGDFAGDLRWHVKNLIIGAPRNWSRNVLEWNLAADENWNPHTSNGGCTECQGALTINSTSGAVTRNVSYYIIAHASKLVRPGSTRILSTIVDGLYNVAFLTPDGKKVLIVVNDNNIAKTFAIGFNKQTVTTSLGAGGVGTYLW